MFSLQTARLPAIPDPISHPPPPSPAPAPCAYSPIPYRLNKLCLPTGSPPQGGSATAAAAGTDRGCQSRTPTQTEEAVCPGCLGGGPAQSQDAQHWRPGGYRGPCPTRPTVLRNRHGCTDTCRCRSQQTTCDLAKLHDAVVSSITIMLLAHNRMKTLSAKFSSPRANELRSI